MRILIDTNIILDVLCKRPNFFEDSAKIFRLCEVKTIIGLVSALSIPNIVYIMRKELNAEKIRRILDTLSSIFLVTDLTIEDLKDAANVNFFDYEDAIQSICAEKAKCDYILTRNEKDFVNSKVLAVSPSEFLRSIFSKI